MALVVISDAGLVSGSLTGVVVDSEETAASSDEKCETSKDNFANLSARMSKRLLKDVSSTAVSSLSTAEATTETVFGCSIDCSGRAGLIDSAAVGSVDFT
jgi:hypothetical protein